MELTSTSNDRRVAESFRVPDWYLRGFAANIRVRAETVAALTKDAAYDHVLDIGCGDGSLSLPLLRQSRQITFLDPSAAMLERVAQRLGSPVPERVALVNSGFLEADLPPAGFDLVICLGVLAYVQDLRPFFAKLGSILRPQGQLLIECTDAGHTLSRLERGYQSLTSLVKPARLQTYPHRPADIDAAAASQGLRRRESFQYAYSLPLLSKLFSPESTYRQIRRFYGAIGRNRRPGFGNQLIIRFVRP